MKAGFAIYWWAGCLLAGCALGFHHGRCPNDKLPPSYEVLAFVAAWPTVIGQIIYEPHPSAPPKCDGQ